MSSPDTAKRGLRAGWSQRRGVGVSEEMVARLGAGVLWVVVLVAVAGGVAAWVRSPPAPVIPPSAPVDHLVDESWAAAALAERFVAAYLVSTRADADRLAPFLGYTPELVADDTDDLGDVGGPVRVADVDQSGGGVWSVTVVVGEPGGEQFWRVGVVSDQGRPVAAGLPTPVAAPVEPSRAVLGVEMGMVPLDDPLVDAVEGFVAAHACGQGALDRWLSPDAVVVRVEPPVCETVELTGWGVAESSERVRGVVVEAVLDRGPRAKTVSYGIEVVERDGRWEVAGLLSVPPGAGEGSEAS